MSGLIANFRLRMRKDVVTTIKRTFGGLDGEFEVAVGSQVSPDTVLGFYKKSGGFETLDLASLLKISVQELKTIITPKIGQTIYQGEVIASKAGIFGGRKVVAQNDSVISGIDQNGLVKLTLLPKRMKLVSGVYGLVEKLDPKGVVHIRCVVTEIYGVLGCGMERSGFIKNIDGSDSIISAKYIKADYRDKILIGGSIVLNDVFKAMFKLGVAGFVTGGIGADDYQKMTGGKLKKTNQRWSDVGLSLVVTEGFGMSPIGNDIYPTLKELEGRFAIIDGNKSRLIIPNWDPQSQVRINQVAGVKLADFSPDIVSVELKVGNRVRIIDPNMIGLQGIVKSIDRSPSVLPSGIRTHLVTIETNSRIVRVPFLNLEVI